MNTKSVRAMKIFKVLPAKPTVPGQAIELQSAKAGDRLQAIVLQLMDEGKVLMELGGMKVEARLDFQVSQGQKLDLVVVKNGFPLWLRKMAGGKVNRTFGSSAGSARESLAEKVQLKLA